MHVPLQMKLFAKIVNYFIKKAPSYIFGWFLNTPVLLIRKRCSNKKIIQKNIKKLIIKMKESNRSCEVVVEIAMETTFTLTLSLKLQS